VHFPQSCARQVSVFDADRFSANDLIGYYQFDLSFVYFQPGHEVFRQVC
jgi:hypothetical protein